MFEIMHAFFTWSGTGHQYRSPHRVVSPVPEIRSDGLPRLRSWNSEHRE